MNSSALIIQPIKTNIHTNAIKERKPAWRTPRYLYALRDGY